MSQRPSPIVRVAAISDMHIRSSSVLRPDALDWLADEADLLVVAGDITESGRLPEVERAAHALSEARIPVFAVLGNHDRRGLRRMAMRRALREAGVELLEAEFRSVTLPGGARVHIAGTTGTGGGFGPENGGNGPAGRFARAVMAKSIREANRLDRVLSAMELDRVDISILVTHFAPTANTLGSEPPMKYWMLGNALLGKVIDDHRLDLVVHGHAHLGSPEGKTPGGTPVRNVAVPSLGHVVVYHVGPGGHVETVVGPRPGIVEDPIEPQPDRIDHRLRASS